MMKKAVSAILAISMLSGIIGCDGGIVLGGKSVGVRSGDVVTSAGYVTATYAYPIERVWQAVDAVLKEMQIADLKTDKKIAEGTMVGLISDEKVTVKVAYAGQQKTSVDILTGLGGSYLASRLLHEKIARQLAQP